MTRRFKPIGLILLLAGCSSSNSIPSPLQSISTPKTIIERAFEARSVEAIGIDTDIYLRANMLMLEHGFVNLTTEVYEGRLLVTGLSTDVDGCNSLEQDLRQISGLRELLWHANCYPREEWRSRGLIGEVRRFFLRTKSNLRLFGAGEVSDVNYRIAIDAERKAILLGRARNADEKRAALAALQEGDGLRGVVDYVEVRP